VLLTYGFMLNDTAARDAARTAANTGDAGSGYAAALTAIASHQGDGHMVQGPTCDSKLNPNDFIFETDPSDGSPPCVTVTAHSRVAAPFSFDIYGARLNIGGMKFARSYTFPILGGSVSTSALDRLQIGGPKPVIPIPKGGG
jgi:hypothetical protein